MVVTVQLKYILEKFLRFTLTKVRSFREATNIISTAGIRVPTSQMVETLVNAEMKRLSARKVAHRFLKNIVQQVSGLPSRLADEEEDESDDEMPNFPAPPAPVSKPKPSLGGEPVNSPATGSV